MKTIKHATLLILIPTLLIPLTTLSMEKDYPQLQLENPKKQKDTMHVDCSIMIAGQTPCYAMKAVHTAIFEHSNIQSTIKDPIIMFHVQKNEAHSQFYLPLPTKLFVNCTDKSTLHIHETDASQLYKSHQIFKKKQLLLNAVCTKNPNLAGNSFAEQFNNATGEFYTNPGMPWVVDKHNQELENAGIITKPGITSVPVLIVSPHGLRLGQETRTTFEHGPNGCTNDECLIKSLIDEKILINESVFKSLMYRQISGSFPKK